MIARADSTDGAALAIGVILQRLLQMLGQNGVLDPDDIRNILTRSFDDLQRGRTTQSSAAAIQFIEKIMSDPIIESPDEFANK